MKKTIIITVSVIILILLGFLLFSGNEQEVQETAVSKTEGNWLLVMGPQEASDTVIISEVVMDRPGYVVIREVINEKPGQIVEVSEYLEAGSHTGIIINLPTSSATGGIDISGEFPISSDLVAVVYSDDGDRGFNPNLDSAVVVDGEALARYVRTGEPAPTSAAVPNIAGTAESDITATVIYTDSGFSPQTVEISQGETVRFVNESSRPMWVASNVHPAHNILPTFDQFGVSGFGESYEYTFEQSGEWKYHDHVNASEIGTIIVR